MGLSAINRPVSISFSSFQGPPGPPGREVRPGRFNKWPGPEKRLPRARSKISLPMVPFAGGNGKN